MLTAVTFERTLCERGGHSTECPYAGCVLGNVSEEAGR